VRSFRIGEDFIRIEEFLPEAEVIVKYYCEQEFDCVIYLEWFRQKNESGGYNRFADVYISKEMSLALIEKIKRKKKDLPIRYTK
jgi:hypothetical protein